MIRDSHCEETVTTQGDNCYQCQFHYQILITICISGSCCYLQIRIYHHTVTVRDKIKCFLERKCILLTSSLALWWGHEECTLEVNEMPTKHSVSV
jgi:hypothetical protein